MAKRKTAGIEHTPHELGIIARADRYVAYLFVGRGNTRKVECATEVEARFIAQRLANEHRRAAIIYAISGHSSAFLAAALPK
jgi:hypothetical protein